MKYIVEQKGTMFLVVNDTTGAVRGRFKNELDAKVQQKELQKQHDVGMDMASARITPPAEIAEEQQ